MASDLTLGTVRSPTVVFVHGFTSSPAVWENFLSLLRADSVNTRFELLTFGYPTRLFNVNPKRVIPNIEACAESLDSFLGRHISPSAPLVLVSHSQGGLVVQRFIADMLEAGRGVELHRLVRVVMFACPNQGSDFFLGIRRLILRRNPQDRRLRPLDEMLNETRRVVLQRAVYANAVTQTTCPLHISAYAGLEDGIVSRSSAKGLFPYTAVLDSDHSSIIQPVSTQDESYLALMGELRAALEHAYVISADAGAMRLGNKAAIEEFGASDIIDTRRPSEVPRAAPAIYGREQDLAAIATGLAHSEPRSSSPCVLLSGRGGSGKTCLARHAALRATQEFPGGQLYCDLANVPTETGSAIAALDHFLVSLGTPPERVPVSFDDKAALYQSLLAGRRILVVIENAADARGVPFLLPATPGSAALVTSRRRLDSLDADIHLHVDKLGADAAVAYLRDASRRSSASFGQVTAADFEALAELCGYFPLALKIAAALLGRGYAGNADALIRALRDDKQRLDVLAVEDLEVRSTLAQAYALLTDGARTLLRRLSLLPRSDFAPWIAAVALEGTAKDPAGVLDELVEANIVDPTATGRLSMHDLVVDFARERTAAEDIQENVQAVTELLFNAYASRARKCRHILEPERPPFRGKIADPNEEQFHMADVADAEQWLEREHVSLVKIMSAAGEKSIAGALIDIANSLPTYFIIRGTWNDWHAGLQLAARSAEYASDLISLGYCLQALANVERTLGHDTGRALLERSYECFSEAEDLEGQAYLMNDVGLVEMYDGEWDNSLRHLQRSEDLLRQIGNEHLALNPLRNRGITYLEKGDISRAIPLLEGAAAGFSSNSDNRWLAFTLGDLGKAYRLAGRREEAESSLNESISLLTSLGEARWCAATKIRYGDLLRVTGKSARALTAYQEAMDAFESLADPLWTARALVGIALINAAAGSLDASLSQLDRSRATFRQFRFESDECWTLVCRFRVLQETDHAAADQVLADAHRIANAMGYASTYVERLLADAGPDVR
jgi:tetratricopeptide (TPR) repeat protein/pimeloyl-ACP methyl ester carboxylesterase